MDSEYHQIELNSNPAGPGSSFQFPPPGNPGPVLTEPSAPLYYEIDHNQGPDAPPPAYSSLFNNAVAFPRNMKQNLFNNIRRTNSVPATEPGVDGVNAADTEANTNANSDDSDEKPDGCFGLFCLFLAVNVFLCGLPIAEIVMGYLYKDDCPTNDKIPLFLFVNGIVFTVGFQQIWLPVEKCKACGSMMLVIINSLGAAFLFGWFIAGSVWVFKIKPDVVLYEDTEIKLPIEGPFRSRTFSLITSAPLLQKSVLIQWNDDSFWDTGRSDRRIVFSYGSFYHCNSTKNLFLYDTNKHEFKEQDIWTFSITSSSLTVWLNGKQAFYAQKTSYRDNCPLWKTDLENIEILKGPVEAIRTYRGRQHASSLSKRKKTKDWVGEIDQDTLCHKKVYNFAFGLLITGYIILGLVILYLLGD